MFALLTRQGPQFSQMARETIDERVRERERESV
jgi:hypothetical protein